MEIKVLIYVESNLMGFRESLSGFESMMMISHRANFGISEVRFGKYVAITIPLIFSILW